MPRRRVAAATSPDALITIPAVAGVTGHPHSHARTAASSNLAHPSNQRARQRRWQCRSSRARWTASHADSLSTVDSVHSHNTAQHGRSDSKGNGHKPRSSAVVFVNKTKPDNANAGSHFHTPWPAYPFSPAAPLAVACREQPYLPSESQTGCRSLAASAVGRSAGSKLESVR